MLLADLRRDDVAMTLEVLRRRVHPGGGPADQGRRAARAGRPGHRGGGVPQLAEASATAKRSRAYDDHPWSSLTSPDAVTTADADRRCCPSRDWLRRRRAPARVMPRRRSSRRVVPRPSRCRWLLAAEVLVDDPRAVPVRIVQVPDPQERPDLRHAARDRRDVLRPADVGLACRDHDSTAGRRGRASTCCPSPAWTNSSTPTRCCSSWA